MWDAAKVFWQFFYIEDMWVHLDYNKVYKRMKFEEPNDERLSQNKSGNIKPEYLG